MSMLEQRIQQQFFESADLVVQTAEALSRPIAQAVDAVVGCVTAGGKLLICGWGPSMADAQRCASYLSGRFDRERPALPALVVGGDSASISSLALAAQGGGGFDAGAALARQIQALGSPGDVLVALCTAATSAPLSAALSAALAKDMSIVLLCDERSARLGQGLTETDVLIAAPAEREARAREIQLLAWHCLCDAVDLQLLGEEEP